MFWYDLIWFFGERRIFKAQFEQKIISSIPSLRAFALVRAARQPANNVVETQTVTQPTYIPWKKKQKGKFPDDIKTNVVFHVNPAIFLSLSPLFPPQIEETKRQEKDH